MSPDTDVLVNGEAGKYAHLRHKPNAAAHPAVGAEVGNTLAGETNFSLPCGKQANQYLEQSRLARAVGAEQYNRFAFVHRQTGSP